MKSPRLLVLVALVTLWPVTLVFAAPGTTITSINIHDTSCVYKVGSVPCNVGPGMTIDIKGSNFGDVSGVVTLCNCLPATIKSWSRTRVTVVVNSVAPYASLYLRDAAGELSNTIPYNALGPVITSIVVGSCTYYPEWSSNQCKITPGTQFTINGSYFGPTSGGGTVVTCSGCGNTAATINNWNSNWLTYPSSNSNQIEVTATETTCGATIAVLANSMWSNYVPYYTSC